MSQHSISFFHGYNDSESDGFNDSDLSHYNISSAGGERDMSVGYEEDVINREGSAYEAYYHHTRNLIDDRLSIE